MFVTREGIYSRLALLGPAAAVRKDAGGWRTLLSGPSAGLECYSSINSSVHTFLSQGLQVHRGAVQAYISLYRLVCTHIVWFVVRMNVDLRRMAALNVDNNAFSSL